MPCLRRPHDPFPIMWKSILEDIDVDCRVIEQLPGTVFSASEEVEIRFVTRLERLSMFVRFETSERSLKIRTQDRLRLGRCPVETAANRCNHRLPRYWQGRLR